LGGISIAIRDQVEVKVRRVLTHLGGISIAIRDLELLFAEHLLAGDVEVNEVTAFVLHFA
jgi:hypothetical protein